MSQTSGNANASGPEDRRRHRRVAVALPGRYLLEDGTEHPCECLDISAGGLRIRAAKAGAWGSRVVVYVDGVGRMDGHLVRRAPGWFAIATHSTSRKEERVDHRIAAFAEAHASENDDRRRLSRKYVERQAVRLIGADGRLHPAEITDISKEGAALMTEAVLAAGDRVRLDGRRARVARVFPGGVALAFDTQPATRALAPLLAKRA